MTVLASKKRKFRNCRLPKVQAEYFQGEARDCQQFDGTVMCQNCQAISSKLHHVSGDGGVVILCSACRRKRRFVERLKSAVPVIHPDAKRPSASLDQNKTKIEFEAAVVGGTQATALELETSDDEEDTQIGGTGSTCSLSGSDQTKLLHSCNTIAQRMEGHKVAYPSRDDPEAVEIVHSDLLRLAPEEFLNDTVIDFYIKYIQRPEALTLDDKKRFHFFNSFFYKKLSEVVRGKRKKGGMDFSKLRKWTKGMNIFEKDYLFVPIHNSLHWSLAIICFPAADATKQSNSECCVIHLDSLITGGHKSQGVFNCLRSYLVAEWKYRRELLKDTEDLCVKKLPLKAESIRGRRVQVPLQDNESDCGLFLLHYIELFVKDAPSTFRLCDLDSKNLFGRSWFPSEDASGLRASILKHLESLFQKEVSLSSHIQPVVLETGGDETVESIQLVVLETGGEETVESIQLVVPETVGEEIAEEVESIRPVVLETGGEETVESIQLVGLETVGEEIAEEDESIQPVVLETLGKETVGEDKSMWPVVLETGGEETVECMPPVVLETGGEGTVYSIWPVVLETGGEEPVESIQPVVLGTIGEQTVEEDESIQLMALETVGEDENIQLVVLETGGEEPVESIRPVVLGTVGEETLGEDKSIRPVVLGTVGEEESIQPVVLGTVGQETVGEDESIWPVVLETVGEETVGEDESMWQPVVHETGVEETVESMWPVVLQTGGEETVESMWPLVPQTVGEET